MAVVSQADSHVVGSIRALSAAMDISERKLAAWAKEPSFPRSREGFDVNAVAEWLLQHKATELAASEPTRTNPATTPTPDEHTDESVGYVTVRIPIAQPRAGFANESLTRVNVTVRDKKALRAMRAVHQGAFDSNVTMREGTRHVDSRSQLLSWLFELIYAQLPDELR